MFIDFLINIFEENKNNEAIVWQDRRTSKICDQLRKNGKIPKTDDEYFNNLARSTEFGLFPPSYSEHFGDFSLGFYRIFGLALFYGLSFLSKPLRIITFIKNIFSSTQNTLLESVIHEKIVRKFKKFQLSFN